MGKVKNKTPLTGETKQKEVLSEKEERFCQRLALNFNRIDAVVEAFDLDTKKKNWRNTASAIAYEYLLKPHINRRLRELLDKFYLNDENVDTELSNLISQNAELNVKSKAISEYNKLKGRYASEKIDTTLTIKTIQYGDNTSV